MSYSVYFAQSTTACDIYIYDTLHRVLLVIYLVYTWYMIHIQYRQLLSSFCFFQYGSIVFFFVGMQAIRRRRGERVRIGNRCILYSSLLFWFPSCISFFVCVLNNKYIYIYIYDRCSRFSGYVESFWKDHDCVTHTTQLLFLVYLFSALFVCSRSIIIYLLGTRMYYFFIYLSVYLFFFFSYVSYCCLFSLLFFFLTSNSAVTWRASEGHRPWRRRLCTPPSPRTSTAGGPSVQRRDFRRCERTQDSIISYQWRLGPGWSCSVSPHPRSLSVSVCLSMCVCIRGASERVNRVIRFYV